MGLLPLFWDSGNVAGAKRFDRPRVQWYCRLHPPRGDIIQLGSGPMPTNTLLRANHKRLSKAKYTYLTPELIAETQNRLSRIDGHIRGIKRMLEEQAECEQILLQLSAVRSALNQVTIKVLQGHMETCIHDCVVGGQGPKALVRLESALAQVLKNA